MKFWYVDNSTIVLYDDTTQKYLFNIENGSLELYNYVGDSYDTVNNTLIVEKECDAVED